jgi:hypothetical protein
MSERSRIHDTPLSIPRRGEEAGAAAGVLEALPLGAYTVWFVGHLHRPG